MTNDIKLLSEERCHNGAQKVFSHISQELKCEMKFAVYEPSQCKDEAVPAVFWLSGLTCNEQNFITKAAGQKAASRLGLIIVCPDTSPRGCNIEGEDTDWDFGSGASFYVDATTDNYKTNYRMFSYITEELPALVRSSFNVKPGKMGIMGHSMGGHGALMCALKKPDVFSSMSAFAPICHPTNCPWGQKAFTGYLGPNKETWAEYDTVELMKKYAGPQRVILVDQGTADKFYTEKQLLTEDLIPVAESNTSLSLKLRFQDQYTHSYYFIQTFVEDHLEHHAQYLKD